MRWLNSLLFLFFLSFSARAELLLNVTLDYDQERDHVATQSVFGDLAKSLSSAVGQTVKLVMTQNAERVGEQIRVGSYAMVLAPSQLVGLAMRNGYTPVARSEGATRVVFLAGPASGVTTFERARGKRLVLPHRESLVSYLVKGDLTAMGLSPSSYFGSVTYLNTYGAALYTLEIGQADLVAVKESVANDWIKAHPGTRVIKSSDVVPLAGVAVSDKLDDALKAKIRAAFTQLDKGIQARLERARLGAFEPADSADFEHVSTRGFYTPEILPGAQIATAEQVRKLMSEGVPLFDVRPQSHYREGHIKGAVSVPYQLNSPKEPDYDDAVDKFDLGKLPKDPNAPMIFQCNGAECWYSYKAARYMVKRGFKRVYWFRTGIPAWKAAGYPIERGA